MPNSHQTRRSIRGRCKQSPSVPYDRQAELPRVLPLWPHEIADESPAGRQLVIAKLARALRAERCRGIAGHWTYDLARHSALLRIYRLELAASHDLQRQTGASQFKSSKLKISVGGITRPNAMRIATATTISASRARNCSALKRSE
jgi:hypothetical protein